MVKITKAKKLPSQNGTMKKKISAKPKQNMKPNKLKKKFKVTKSVKSTKPISKEIEEDELSDICDASINSDASVSDQEQDQSRASDDEHESVNNDENEPSEDGEMGFDDVEEHKNALSRLRETDPEFYSYLQDNDKKLLNFNLSDDDDNEDDEKDEDEQVHVPDDKLEVASDESDFEPDDDEDRVVDSRVITLKQLKQWQSVIQTDKSKQTITCLIKAFNAALKRVSSDEDNEPTTYKVDGSSVFNGVIQLCVLELGPAIRSYLGLKSGTKQPPHKCKKFAKVKNLLKGYFTDLLKLLGSVTSTNILNVLLKHLHYMSPLIVSFQNVAKTVLKKLVSLWGSAEESVKVVAFLCILRITHNQQQSFLDSVLRMMYMSYVKNSKFVSVNTLPSINFMRRSLVEMYSLDLNVSYEHVFLFIRQLAINLRNAITVNKKENIQTVYNWQFVNSLKLWGNLLASTCNKPQLQPLIYPFTQVCLGTIKLIPTAQYYPLRFHIVQILMDLSKETGIFIPVLPFILEVLTAYDFNKKHTKVSMKPLNFTCLLRLSKSQLSENGFKDTAIETIYSLLLEYTAAQSQSIAFPDMCLFCKLHIKEFLKNCKNHNYKSKISQILEKIEQNMTFIEKERQKVSFSLTDVKQINGWETTIKNKGTPLNTFYENWNKVRLLKKRKEVTKNEELGEYNLPSLKKHKLKESKGEDKMVLFPSDSEDEEVTGTVGKKSKRGKRGGKKNKKVVVGNVDDDVVGEDIVENFKMSDW